MSKAGFSIADLQKGAKRLNTVETDEKAESKKPDEIAQQDLQALEDLYNKYNGDLDLIFGELKANPSKAKKPHHRPKNSREFAEKYLQGFYSIIEDETAADAKSHK